MMNILVSSLFLFISDAYAAVPLALGPFQTVRTDYTVTNVGTSSWVQLVSSLKNSATMFEIFDSCGQTMEIGVGAAGSEQRIFIQYPGGNSQIPVTVNQGSRISIRAISAPCSSGENDINFYN